MALLTRTTSSFLTAALAAMALVACDDVQPTTGTATPTPEGCTPGAVDFCVCPTIEIGVQECLDDGTWSACDCSVPVVTDTGRPDVGSDVDAPDTSDDVSPDAQPNDTGTDTTPADTGEDTEPEDAGHDVPDTPTLPDVTVETCGPEGPRFDDEDYEEEMYPGRPCIQCHLEELIDDHDKDDDIPFYAAAGTVFPNARYEDDCRGVAGVTIEIKDAEGNFHRMESNRVGNFFIEGYIPTPYTAEVIRDGVRIPMLTAQTNLDCNYCHSETGREDAAGRIVAP